MKRTINIQYLNQSKQQGFTLIELLVASTLSLIIILALGGAFLKTRLLNVDNMRRISAQQEARTALNMMAYTIRNAGSYGCYSYNDTTNAMTRNNNNMQSFFFDNNPRPAFSNVRILSNDVEEQIVAVIPQFDATFDNIQGQAIVVQGGYSNDYQPNGDGATAQLFASWTSGDQSLITDMKNREWVVISDCQNARLLPGSGNLTVGANTVVTNPENFVDCANGGAVNCFNSPLTTVRTYSEYLYFVATEKASNRQGLFRLQLASSNDGGGTTFDLTKPQLLVDGSGQNMSMAVDGLYLNPNGNDVITACNVRSDLPDPLAAEGTNAVMQEKQSLFTNVTSNLVATPVLVNVTLRMNKVGSDQVLSYPISTTIRGSNICANNPA